MITIQNVQLKHNGLLADNSTKLTLYLPECTDNQHLEVIRMAKEKTVGIILVNPDQLEEITDLIRQAIDATVIQGVQPPIDPIVPGSSDTDSTEVPRWANTPLGEYEDEDPFEDGEF